MPGSVEPVSDAGATVFAEDMLVEDEKRSKKLETIQNLNDGRDLVPGRVAGRTLCALLSFRHRCSYLLICCSSLRFCWFTSSGSDIISPLIEEAPEDDKIASALGIRLPKPYRRLHPIYTESAADAEVEATVDVLVDIGADGEVHQVQIARWAGFGLDESTVATVRQLHFFPAMRDGTQIPMRVLLRYNFRKPPQ